MGIFASYELRPPRVGNPEGFLLPEILRADTEQELFAIVEPLGTLAYAADTHILYGSNGATWVAISPASVPGAIILWDGLLANMPFGFVLCDGANGTPHLPPVPKGGGGFVYYIVKL